MPTSYDPHEDYREIENKDLQKLKYESIKKEMGGETFTNQIWWRDFVFGVLGCLIVYYANKHFLATYNLEGYPYKMLWAVLQPIGLIMGVRLPVGLYKLCKRLRNH